MRHNCIVTDAMVKDIGLLTVRPENVICVVNKAMHVARNCKSSVPRSMINLCNLHHHRLQQKISRHVLRMSNSF